MNFKDLKAGHILYLLNRDTVELQSGSITNTTLPHVDNKIGAMSQLVVDITITIGDKQSTYVTPESAAFTYCGPVLVTADKNVLLDELRAIKAKDEQELAMMDTRTERVGKCNTLIAELDEVFKEKQENEARLTKIEKMVQSLLDKLA